MNSVMSNGTSCCVPSVFTLANNNLTNELTTWYQFGTENQTQSWCQNIYPSIGYTNTQSFSQSAILLPYYAMGYATWYDYTTQYGFQISQNAS
jgi:hypothetical protein